MAKLIALLTLLDGRISRKWFWIGIIITFAGAIIVSFVLSNLLGADRAMNPVAMLAGDGELNSDIGTLMAASSLAGWINTLVFAITFVPMMAVFLKRRHDRGRKGTEVWVFAVLFVSMWLLQATGVGYQISDFNGIAYPAPTLIAMLVTAFVGGLGLYLLIVCGFLIGDRGENSYGPDPLIGLRP